MFPKHNFTYNHDKHYISYNFADDYIYGCDTTAIVIGQMQRFYILNGNHTNELKTKSFKECIDYFLDNSHLINKRSNKYNENDAINVIEYYENFKKGLVK